MLKVDVEAAVITGSNVRSKNLDYRGEIIRLRSKGPEMYGMYPDHSMCNQMRNYQEAVRMFLDS
jgi:hypothetical protein